MRFANMSIIILLGIVLTIGCGDEDGTGPGTGGGYSSTTVNNITLQWMPDTLGNLLVKVSAPTDGWVAVGFDPTIAMQDANIIIGYVSNDTAYIRDDYGTGLNSHASDIGLGGTDDVTDIAGTETGGVTEITFTIPLDSGDAYDRVLVVGQVYSVILAYGDDDAYGTSHTVRVGTNIEI
jgi:hypothetical protein